MSEQQIAMLEGWTTLRIFTIAACVLEVVVSVIDFFDFDVPRMILGIYAM